MKLYLFRFAGILLFGLMLIACSEKEKSKSSSGVVKSEELTSVRHVTTVMTIKDINLEERLFILQYADGNTTVLRAEPDLPNIDEIRVGDEVEVKYLKSVVVFVTAPDSTRPVVSKKRTVRAELEEGKPVEYIVDVVEKASTVLAIDHENRHAILKDSEGHVHEVDLSHQVENIENLSVGDQIIYHTTESYAVHLIKV